LFRQWRLERRVQYEIRANWKLVAENFMEYYHLPWVHPGLVKVSPMADHHRWQGPGKYVGFCTSPIAANTDDGGWKGLPDMPGLEGSDAYSARFACPDCQLSFPEIEPRTFSFNSPYGACPTCEGLGSRLQFDPELVLPDESLSLAGGAVAAWKGATPAETRKHKAQLRAFLQAAGFTWDRCAAGVVEVIRELL